MNSFADRRPRRHGPVALIPVALCLLALWAMMSGGRAPTSLPRAASALVVFLCCFGALAFDLVPRLAAIAAGALLSVVLGTLLRFYDPARAAIYLFSKLDTLVLLGGVGVMTDVLSVSGLLDRVAAWMVEISRADRRKVAVLLCVATYVLSCFANNLATIMVMVPISLLVAEAIELDAEALVLAEVIASNLGGASTMIGDFPNMLIATETGLPFHEFMRHLAPVCLVELAILLAWLVIDIPDRPAPAAVDGLVRRLREQPWNSTAAWRGVAILGSALAAFVVAGEVGLSPAVVAALGGACALVLGGIPARTLLRRMGFGDIAFFACLFVMVGAVEASGLFGGMGRLTGRVLWASPALGAVAIAWVAALVTALLNAGPTTALLVHVLRLALAPWAAGETVWWALSLGVCAGSSATLTGATAGPVSASLMEARGRELTFRRFARTGIPMMLGFMLVNTLFLLWMVRGQ